MASRPVINPSLSHHRALPFKWKISGFYGNCHILLRKAVWCGERKGNKNKMKKKCHSELVCMAVRSTCYSQVSLSLEKNHGLGPVP